MAYINTNALRKLPFPGTFIRMDYVKNMDGETIEVIIWEYLDRQEVHIAAFDLDGNYVGEL